MLAQALIITGASLLSALGTLHLVYTFFTDRLNPRDAATRSAMQASHPVLTRRMSIWGAWTGFNASHSLGVMLFGALYLILATAHMAQLRAMTALMWLAVAGSAGYLLIGMRYWFRTPTIGIAIATACFLGAALLSGA